MELHGLCGSRKLCEALSISQRFSKDTGLFQCNCAFEKTAKSFPSNSENQNGKVRSLGKELISDGRIKFKVRQIR